jgi:hypothetical protein
MYFRKILICLQLDTKGKNVSHEAPIDLGPLFTTNGVLRKAEDSKQNKVSKERPKHPRAFGAVKRSLSRRCVSKRSYKWGHKRYVSLSFRCLSLIRVTENLPLNAPPNEQLSVPWNMPLNLVY